MGLCLRNIRISETLLGDKRPSGATRGQQPLRECCDVVYLSSPRSGIRWVPLFRSLPLRHVRAPSPKREGWEDLLPVTRPNYPTHSPGPRFHTRKSVSSFLFSEGGDPYHHGLSPSHILNKENIKILRPRLSFIWHQHHYHYHRLYITYHCYPGRDIVPERFFYPGSQSI